MEIGKIVMTLEKRIENARATIKEYDEMIQVREMQILKIKKSVITDKMRKNLGLLSKADETTKLYKEVESILNAALDLHKWLKNQKLA